MPDPQFRDIPLKGLSNNLAEGAESGDNAWASFNTFHDRGVLEGIRRYKQIGARPSPSPTDVGYGLGYGKSSGNETQKLVVTGSPTGGTVKLTWNDGSTTYSAASGVAYNATSDVMYAYLQTLVNTGVYGFRPGDINVSGGPWPGTPIEVEYVGRYANTDVNLLVLDTNSLSGGTAPTVTITEKIKGGTSEVIYAVVQPGGTGDATLYAITSSDGFETTTWTSLSTTMAASDWFFEQFDRREFFCNSVDGLKYVYIGSTALNADPPSAPTVGPNFGNPLSDDEIIILGTGASYASTGFTTAPTFTAANYACQIKLNGTEDGNAVTVTITLAADIDISAQDIGKIAITASNGATWDEDSMRVSFINADGSPVTLSPLAYGNPEGVTGTSEVHRWFQLAGNQRYSRDNIHKVVFAFTIRDGGLNDLIFLHASIYSNWMNDNLGMAMGPPLQPVVGTNSYFMTYYRASDGVHSLPSPITSGPSVPASTTGAYYFIGGYGSTELSSSDEQYFWRFCKSDSTYRAIPNLYTKNGSYQYTDFGVANDPTGANDGQFDHWMDYELTSFPKFESLGFPPISTGATADVLGVWKQCLAVGSGKLVYNSWVGQPLKFEPSPDTPGYVSPDPGDFPDVGVTEYASDNRSEDIMAILGQDTEYIVTNLSSYAKVGDTPAESSVPRRLPGSRGAIGKRSCYRYGGGILVGSQDALVYYSVGRGFSGTDNGSLVERFESDGVNGQGGIRRSYERLLSEVQMIQFTGNDLDGTWDLTVNSETIYGISATATPLQVRYLLEDLPSINRGDIEVFGEELVDAEGNAGGKMYFRFLQQYKRTDVAALSTTSHLTGNGAGITVTTLTTGGGSGLVVVEFEDEYWLFNGRNYLHQSRGRQWSEGIFRDSIKAVIANRERGLILMTAQGTLVKVVEGLTTDNGGDTLWQYESPWLTGPRSRIVGAQAVVDGSVTMRIYTDDGAGSVDSYGAKSPHVLTTTLDESKITPLGVAIRPGIRHKILLTGRVGFDTVKSLRLMVEPSGGTATGS